MVPEIKLASIAPKYVTATYIPTKAGETCKALAATGAITGKVRRAIATMA